MYTHVLKTTAATLVMALSTTLCLSQNQAHVAEQELQLGELGRTWVEIGGEVYGARPIGLGPIGGGPGYHDIHTTGALTAATLDELTAALRQAGAGDVIYVPEGVEIDLTGQSTLRIPGGVTLAGNRGHEGSPGALIKRLGSGTMLQTDGDHVRVTGLRFEGAYGGTERVATNSGFLSISHYGCEVDNCEIYNFNVRGIGIGPSAMGAYIHHNYLHHIWRTGLGYPVSTSASDVRVIANRFSHGRHHIASSGRPGSGYEFAHNWIGPEAISHHVDMHGGRDRGDGTDIAGDWMHVHHNTFEGTVRPIAVRGVPSHGAWIHNNWFHLPEPSQRVIRPWPVGGSTRIHLYNNAYGEEQPLIADTAFDSYPRMFASAMAAFQAENYLQARTRFARAAELAATAVERAAALLHIGHCHMDMGVGYAAQPIYEQVLDIAEADAGDRTVARERLQELAQKQAQRPRVAWRLAFADDFERAELGDDYRSLRGHWQVEGGALRVGSGHSEIIVNRSFPGLHRVELEILTPPDTVRPCDFSPAIQSAPPAAGAPLRAGGYWLQFGGSGNTLNRILRNGTEFHGHSADRFIEPGRVHHMIAEFDGEMVRLIVDGVTIMECPDPMPLLGPGHETVGLVTYNVAHVRSLKVFTSQGVP